MVNCGETSKVGKHQFEVYMGKLWSSTPQEGPRRGWGARTQDSHLAWFPENKSITKEKRRGGKTGKAVFKSSMMAAAFDRMFSFFLSDAGNILQYYSYV